MWSRMHYPAGSLRVYETLSGTTCHLRCYLLFVGLNPILRESLGLALDRSRLTLQPHTRNQYQRQFKLYLAFVISRGLTVLDDATSVLLFLKFLAFNGLSYRVINNYVSALKFFFESYTWTLQVFESHLIRRMLRGIKLSVYKQPTPKGVFSLEQIHEICRLSNQFDNPMTYRVAFLLGFCGFLRISYVAPTCQKSFMREKHLLRQGVVFQHPGLHLNLKWAKNIQALEKAHTIKLPYIQGSIICPTQSLSPLLQLHSLHPSVPFFFSRMGHSSLSHYFEND